MKTTKMLAILVLALVSQARGIEHLTINGEDVDSINLSLGKSCTIEVVSSGGMPYIRRLYLTNFSVSDLELIEIKPEAGAGALVTPVGETEYQLTAGTGMVAGVHFVFGYTATATGQKEVELRYLLGGDPIDSIVINVTPALAGTAFTYQGRLIDANSIADGLYDFQFMLYDAPSGGNLLVSAIEKNEIDVIDGYFTVELDFGAGVFNGDARWLEIGVRPGEQNDPDVYTVLEPRQKVTPTPYALQTRGIFVDDAGNVGIGTTNPRSTLSVGGDGYESYSISASGRATGVYGEGDTTGVYGKGDSYGVYGHSWDSSGGENYGVYADAASFGSNTAYAVKAVVHRGGSNGTYYSGHFSDRSSYGTYAGLYADLRSGDAIDIAEYILDTEGNTEAGDVLVADPENDESIIKAHKPYDATVVGIVSTEPHMVIGMELIMNEETGELYEGVDAAMLALAGRVPVKVIDENGPIKRGDLLTTSSKAGYAMKWTLVDVTQAEDFEQLKSMLAENERRRNAVVAKALENLDSGDGKIMALVNLQ